MVNKKIIAIIQGRLGSLRLPKKILLKLGKKTVLSFLVDRISKSKLIDDKIFNCKPVMASVQLKNGEYYFETVDDEHTPLIDQLPVTQFLIDDDDVFYKNNKNRKFIHNGPDYLYLSTLF